MEEKRPGQTPEAEISESDPDTAARSGTRTPPDEPLPTERERELLKDADAKAERDRVEMRAHGFGDHKGEEGF